MSLDVGIAIEELGKVLFTEVAGVVEHDVQDDLHTLGVSCVDKVLEFYILVGSPVGAALIAKIHIREVHGMIAVEVGA